MGFHPKPSCSCGYFSMPESLLIKEATYLVLLERRYTWICVQLSWSYIAMSLCIKGYIDENESLIYTSRENKHPTKF